MAVVEQMTFGDYVLTTWSDGKLTLEDYLVDANGNQYIDLSPNSATGTKEDR